MYFLVHILVHKMSVIILIIIFTVHFSDKGFFPLNVLN